MSSAAAATQEIDAAPVLAALDDLLKQRDDAGVKALFNNLVYKFHRQLKQALLNKYQEQKAEGVSTEQLVLLFKQLEEILDQEAESGDQKLKRLSEPKEKEAKKPRAQPPRRRAIPAHLPVVENPISVPADERACPGCGTERVCIGHDVTRIIDIEPARAIVREDRREKLACKTCQSEVVRAPIGDKVVEGGAYGAQLVADMVVSKYDDGLPLERQRQRYGRLGLDIPSASMGDQITWVTDLLSPVARALLDAVLASDNMHLDATSLPVLDKDSPRGIKTGALWGYVGVDVDKETGHELQVAAYLYNRTAKKNAQHADELGPEEVLALRRKRGKPHVVADASGLFDASFLVPGLLEIACSMHARRYFQKALEAGDQRAALPIGAYKKLYDIEESVRGKSPALRREARQEEAKPLYKELISWCQSYRPKEPPSSLLGKAIGYADRHQIALMRYIDDGTLPIDNGIVERLHKRPAMGRRAYLFAGSDAGAQRAAVAYSVLGTCRLLGINPDRYLCDVLPRLARGICIKTDLPALMPAAWQRARPAPSPHASPL